MRIITAKQAEQFIGKEVCYAKEVRVKILGVHSKSKSILVDHLGENIWLYLPGIALESIELLYHEHQP